MSKICKFCGKPVKRNEEYYDVFEGMHWLCFHLNFEHDTSDPDEPCNDPSCPWNRIGKNLYVEYANIDWDVKIKSLNNSQLIKMKLYDWEGIPLPSICMQIGLLGSVAGYTAKTVWYELEAVGLFINSLRTINESAKGKAILKGMSEGNFDIEVENIDNKGHFILKYTFGFHEYIHDCRFESSLRSGIEIDLRMISKITQEFENIRSRVIEKR